MTFFGCQPSQHAPNLPNLTGRLILHASQVFDIALQK
jgi:hypothetical protein